MDLMTIAARLFLDRSGYDDALAGAEQAAFDFAGQLDRAMALAETTVGAAMSAIGGEIAGASGAWGRDMMENFIGGIADMRDRLRDAVSDVARTVRNYLGFSEPEEGPLSDFHTYAPDMMALFARGVRENAGLVADAVGGALDFAPGIAAAEVVETPATAHSERPVNVIFEFDGVQRWVYRLNKAEEQRVGVKLSGVTE